MLRYDWVDSTNDEAMARAREGAAEWTIVVAQGQRAGRGRLSRMWESPYGKNLLASIVLRPPMSPEAAQPLTLVVGVAVAEAVQELIELDVGIKWPNDLWIDGKKCGGILTEATVCDANLEHVVVGLGLNVNTELQDYSEMIREQTTSLQIATGQTWDRDMLLEAIVTQLQGTYATFCAEGFPAIRKRLLARAVLQGKPVVVQDGFHSIEGVVNGVEDNGALRVTNARNEVFRVVSGDVKER